MQIQHPRNHLPAVPSKAGCQEFGSVVLEALVYVDLVTEEGAPRTEYIGRINAALRDAGLSPEYVAGAVRRFIPPEV